MATEQLAVLEDLGRACIALGGHVARLLEQRQIGVRLDVAHATRVAVPVPGTAEIAGFLNHREVAYTALGQVDGDEHPRKAATDDDDLGLFGERIAGEARLDVGVAVERRVLARELLVLADPVGTEALLALALVLLSQVVDGKLHVHRPGPRAVLIPRIIS